MSTSYNVTYPHDYHLPREQLNSEMLPLDDVLSVDGGDPCKEGALHGDILPGGHDH